MSAKSSSSDKKETNNENTDKNKKTDKSDANKSLKSQSQSSSGSQTSQTSSGSNRSAGMGASLRMTSTDIRELTKETQSVGESVKLTAEGGSPPGESIYDTIAYIILCEDHNKIAICRSDKDKTSWLPFIYCPANKTWRDASVDGVSIIFNKQDAELDAKLGTKIPIKAMNCLHVFRTQLPTKQVFLTLVIQCVLLDKNTDTFKCCQNTKRIQWMPLKDAIGGQIDNVWGPEVENFAKLAKKPQPTGLTEVSTDRAFFYVPKANAETRNPEEELIKGAQIGSSEAELLYSDFIEHCFPSLSMSMYSFKEYVTKYFDDLKDKKDDQIFKQIYNGFNYERNNCLNFNEFLLGLAAMEPNSPNAESRTKFVFRFYDMDGDRKLSEQEFRKMIKDINTGSSDDKIEQLFKKGWEGMSKEGFIDLEAFCKGVSGKTHINGTSGLCRSAKGIFKQITQKQTNSSEKKTAIKKKAGFLMKDRQMLSKGLCLACRAKKYDYGLHCVKLDTNGRCVEPRRIFEPETIEKAMKYSIEYTFNTRSIGNSFIDLIRGFSLKKDTDTRMKGFMANDAETLITYLKFLIQDLNQILITEDRLVKLNSPTFVFGDLFGNLDDLLAFERQLWQSFPVVSAHYLFLGNYVDKGKWGVECALYLFALKIISPTKFILLRGKHESRDKQIESSFQKECQHKYGIKNGLKIWEMINTVFDRLPLVSVIDETIFCSHSGVSNTANTVDSINQIPHDLKQTNQNTIANELVNGDPLPDPNNQTLVKQYVKKFEDNVRNFLKLFGFSHMIRSDQLPKDGYSTQLGGKCLTIFSSSRFGGQNNQSICVFVDIDRIRIIRLDTTPDKKETTETATKTEFPKALAPALTPTTANTANKSSAKSSAKSSKTAKPTK